MKRLSLVCIAAIAPALASASIVPTGSAVADAGRYTWRYELQIASEGSVLPGWNEDVPRDEAAELPLGAFVTIYDFAGYVAGTCTGPAGWICKVRNANFLTQDALGASSLSSSATLTWVHTSQPLPGGATDGVIPGPFTAQSMLQGAGLLTYASRDAQLAASLQGTTRGPAALAVPEPGTLVLAGMALALMGGLRARR